MHLIVSVPKDRAQRSRFWLRPARAGAITNHGAALAAFIRSPPPRVTAFEPVRRRNLIKQLKH